MVFRSGPESALNVGRQGTVRCLGLWAGIDLHESAGGARKYIEALKDKGLLAKETHVHTIRLAPPLVITKDELDRACDLIADVLAT